MHRNLRKLTLNRETLRNLETTQLRFAGAIFYTQFCTRAVACSATACDSYCLSNCATCEYTGLCTD